ncbi:T-cell surface glycoprotein CD8 beta chain [Pelobates fuscus]|uniref:T-cell surface glycoprotein CD8 beta chain n=1 Tax=Pelobates fuscus TaxID=191477 RepID=UPI002FE4DFE6
MTFPKKKLLWFFHFILISLYISGIHCFASVTQTPNSSYSLVNSQTEITCTMKSYSIDQLKVYWYRESSMMPNAEFVVGASVTGRNIYNDNFKSKDRFFITRDSFQRSFVLKIKNVNRSDTGVYYCMVEEASKMVIGSGTMLYVVDKLPTRPPTLKPTTASPPCKCKGKEHNSKSSEKGFKCSPFIWGPLAGGAVILMILLGFVISHTRRVYVRSRHFFTKHFTK